MPLTDTVDGSKIPKNQLIGRLSMFIPLFTGFYASFRWLTTPDLWTINTIDWWHRAPTLHAIPSKEMMNQTGRTQNKISMTSGIKTFKVNMILGTKKRRLHKSIFFEFDPVVTHPKKKLYRPLDLEKRSTKPQEHNMTRFHQQKKNIRPSLLNAKAL